MRRIQKFLTNDYLKELMEGEIERLRKRFFPYKRRQFLYMPVEIQLNDSWKYAGCYENNCKGFGDFEYSHKINISASTANRFMRYSCLNSKREAKQEVLDIIRHELIHAFVFEHFEGYFKIEDTHSDYSPIFLSCLWFAGGTTNHNFTDEFFKTELFNKIKDVKDFDILYAILVMKLSEYDYAIDTINRNNNNIKVAFQDKSAGMKGIYYGRSNYKVITPDGAIETQQFKYGGIRLGFLTTPEKLKNKYLDKLECAEEIKDCKIYMNLKTGYVYDQDKGKAERIDIDEI